MCMAGYRTPANNTIFYNESELIIFDVHWMQTFNGCNQSLCFLMKLFLEPIFLFFISSVAIFWLKIWECFDIIFIHSSPQSNSIILDSIWFFDIWPFFGSLIAFVLICICYYANTIAENIIDFRASSERILSCQLYTKWTVHVVYTY